MPITNKSVLALDVGQVRVGVALASLTARLASPLLTLPREDKLFERLAEIIDQEEVGALVVGLPRGLEGQTTAQTVAIGKFVKELKQHTDLPVHLQDEALTSHEAEAELRRRGRVYNKADIDALAATYILEDWLSSQGAVND